MSLNVGEESVHSVLLHIAPLLPMLSSAGTHDRDLDGCCNVLCVMMNRQHSTSQSIRDLLFALIQAHLLLVHLGNLPMFVNYANTLAIVQVSGMQESLVAFTPAC